MSEADAATRERGRRELGAGVDDFLLTYVGFVYPGKGIEPLLRGFRQVALERRNVRLAILGGSLARPFPDQPNFLETMQALARELGIDRQVVWTGEYRWDNEIASVYLRASDTCVLPFEGGVRLNNSSFSSAAAHGLPIVTTYDSAIEPQFDHGENVWLCPPQSPAALADAIKHLIDHAAIRKRLAEGSLRFARDWYSWDTAMDKTLALFRAPPPGPSQSVAQSLS